MKQPLSPVSGTLEQVYLLERDAGLMCRILGLYAARGVDVLRVEYAYAAQDVMTLKVGVTPLSGEGCADVLRVLVARAASRPATTTAIASARPGRSRPPGTRSTMCPSPIETSVASTARVT